MALNQETEFDHYDSTRQELEKQREALVSRLQKAVKRQQGKLRKLGRALEECAEEETVRRYGELLKANLSKIRRGLDSVKVPDYYGDVQNEIEIKIIPEKTPVENMEAYFKKARKLKHGKPRIERQMELAREEIFKLEGLGASVVNCSDYETLEELAEKVEKALAPKKPKKIKGKPSARLSPKRFVSSEGFEILVGRNQKQNDRLTLTIARGSDLFMHSAGSPGSHVIIRTAGNKTVPKQTMLEAANLAIYYSKLRNSRYADVSWTHVKNVSKPRRAKPGLVYLSKHKVLGIEPDENLIKMLHENAVEL